MSNVQQQQPTSGNFNQQYQHSTDQNSQSFSGNNNRQHNYTCSNNQPSSWIRPHVQLQAIPVTVFSETVSIETYALLDSGSDNTQITKTIPDVLGIRDRKCVTIPVASLYQEHTIETTEIFLGIGAIDSSRHIINLPVFAIFYGSQLWYLPHHPVEHKQKKKIRRVTNAASIYKGHSLNKAFLTGPDLLCSLVGLLLRFRQFAIAVTGDIEAMFMQIAVRKEDQDALRFPWYKNNTETIYKYKRLIFGATCSPSCAIYVLRKCAINNHHLSPEASQSITNNFYMDDFLQSFETTDEAIEQTTCIKETLKKEDST